MRYNTTKNKWDVHELHIMLATKGIKELEKKFIKKHDKGKGSLKNNDDSLQIQKKCIKGQ